MVLNAPATLTHLPSLTHNRRQSIRTMAAAATSTPARPDPGGLRRLLEAMGYPRTAEFSVDGARARVRVERAWGSAWKDDETGFDT